jgi:hypothetical protein
MADQNPPPGYGGQQPPSSPGGPGDAGGYGGPPPGYGGPPPGYGPGYGVSPGPQNPPSKTPTVLSVIGIVCWFLCSPAAIILGGVAQTQFRKEGRPDALAKTAWIGGIVSLVLGIVVAIARASAHQG